MTIQKIISASLSPNAQKDDVLLALSVFCRPWLWQRGRGISLVQQWFENKFPHHCAYTFNSGRSAEYEILQAFGIGKGDEVIVQAFTCVAVPNSVVWVGAKPIYADIDSSLNANVASIEKKITSKTKAIIVQHTFGNPADIEQIVALARKKHLLVIEDCAHALGVEYKNRWVGGWGDAAFFSFGRDKVVSSVFGGIGIIHSSHKAVLETMNRQYLKMQYPKVFWILQQLLHPIVFAVILPFYTIFLGKMLLVLLQKLHLLSLPVYPEEKKAHKPQDFPALLPNGLALLAVHQLDKLSHFTKIRRHAQTRYASELRSQSGIQYTKYSDTAVFLRFPLLVEAPEKLYRYAKDRGVLLGRWYSTPVDPKGVDYDAIEFDQKGAPTAQKITENIINLPTLIRDSDVSRIIEVVQSFYKRQL